MVGLLLAKTKLSQCLRIYVVYWADARLPELHPFRVSCGIQPKIGHSCNEEEIEKWGTKRSHTRSDSLLLLLPGESEDLGQWLLLLGGLPLAPITCVPCTLTQLQQPFWLSKAVVGISKIGSRAVVVFPFWKFAVQVSCLFLLCLELILYA